MISIYPEFVVKVGDKYLSYDISGNDILVDKNEEAFVFSLEEVKDILASSPHIEIEQSRRLGNKK